MRIWLLAACLLLAGCAGPGTDDTDTPPTTTTTGGPVTPGTAPEWGPPSNGTLRPGINMEYDGASCTTSFLAQQDWQRYFVMTAAHCVSDGEGCDGSTETPDQNATLLLTDGTTTKASVAYHSWATMNDVDESDQNACDYNDFALLELAPADVAIAHPASLHFRAPTGLAETPTDTIWGYGASILKQGVQESHPKRGTYLSTDYDGWQHHVYLASPGIPGDSGGHIMTEDGQALGIASTITIAPTPGSNHYTDVKKSLEYMEANVGWAPELITWDDFNASLS